MTTTPFRARFVVFGLSLCSLAVAANALYRQEGSKRLGLGPTTSLSVAQLPQGETAVRPSLPLTLEARAAKLKAAIARELSRKGYAQGQVPADRLAPWVLIYEYDAGLALTGEANEALLKQLLFDANPAPRGSFADRAELNGALVQQVQRTLLGLGFFSGALSGRMDSWTQKAIGAYQAQRHLAPDGRLCEATLLDLIEFSGAPLRQAAAN